LKYETVITRKNGGNHNPPGTKKAWNWLDVCSKEYRSPRLYHLVFCAYKELAAYMGYRGYKTNKELLKDLMQRLRRKAIRCSYRACREIDDGPKGDHLHVFLCCDASAVNPAQVLNLTTDGWLYQYAKDVGAYVHLNEPKDPMHSGQRYMSLPPSKPEKILDAKVWISYLFKRRTKPDFGEIYTSSRTL
jgi:hypothetical protein